jgi:hypothetical protein
MARHYYLNRTLCDVLEEMRKCVQTLNFGPLPGLIEEAQSMGNRMEAALGDDKDLQAMHDEWHRLKKELGELRKEHKALGGEDKDDY